MGSTSGCTGGKNAQMGMLPERGYMPMIQIVSMLEEVIGVIAQDCSGRQNRVLIFFLDFGRILVRDVVHWIRFAETPNLPVFLHP